MFDLIYATKQSSLIEKMIKEWIKVTMHVILDVQESFDGQLQISEAKSMLTNA